jgi:hypothetical protein
MWARTEADDTRPRARRMISWWTRSATARTILWPTCWIIRRIRGRRMKTSPSRLPKRRTRVGSIVVISCAPMREYWPQAPVFVRPDASHEIFDSLGRFLARSIL